MMSARDRHRIFKRALKRWAKAGCRGALYAHGGRMVATETGRTPRRVEFRVSPSFARAVRMEWVGA